MSSPIPCGLARWPNRVPPERRDWMAYGPFGDSLADLASMRRIRTDIIETCGAGLCVAWPTGDGETYLIVPNRPAVLDAFMVMIEAAEQDEDFVTDDDLLDLLDELVELTWSTMFLPARFELLDANGIDVGHAGDEASPSKLYLALALQVQERHHFDVSLFTEERLFDETGTG